ncbi:MAG: hypothetical protein M3015_10010 [Bacteroidota bacterium]|nr:hypothetical protein [Bacteroidota bacterium]
MERYNVAFAIYIGRIVMKKSAQLNKGASQIILNETNFLPPGIYVLKSYFNNITTQNKLLKTN